LKYILYNSPIGIITIKLKRSVVKGIEFGTHVEIGALNDDIVLGMKVVEELDGYFSGISKSIQLDSEPDGTEFQKAVWNRLLQIPYGETATYKEIASGIGKPGSYRAVGNACRKNPIPIIIPCHRVVGSDGKLTGYAGGLEAKEKLLKIEKSNY